jgi:hypothetical protein
MAHQIVEDANITVNMSALRKALGENPRAPLHCDCSGAWIPVHSRSARDGWRRQSQGGPPDRTPPSAADELAEHKTPPTNKTDDDSKWKWRRAVVVCAVLLVIGALTYSLILTRSDQTRTGTIKSIGVLPFKPMSQSGRDEYLELGMADSLITKLSGAGQIVVRPISATRKYTDFEQDPLVAGRELRVEAVLEGSIKSPMSG